MSEHDVRRVVIRGRVQGVGFRAFVEHTALQRGVEGWVRNRRDGSVEALFSGSADDVAEMMRRCQQGPRAAQVASVELLEEGGTAPAGFELRPTA